MENYHPKYAFLGYGIYGFILGIACFFLSRNSERDFLPGEEPVRSDYSSEVMGMQTPSDAARVRRAYEDTLPPVGKEGCCYNTKKNFRLIGQALKRKEIYCIVIYFILDGLTNPSFADFTYFFLMNVIGVSKFMFAMITLIGQVCQVIGVIVYEKFLKEVEVRWILFWNVIISIVGAFLAFSFAMRWNLAWGMSDYFFLIFTDVVFGAVQMAFSTLPILALFAKITPKRIEGTMYAFLTGTSNLDQGVIQPMLGAWINN